MSEVLQLVDASSVIFRAWFGRPPTQGNTGKGRSAIDGWLHFLWQLERSQPCGMGALAFDESLGSGFRHRLYTHYKAQRSLPDADLAWQLQQCKVLAESLGWLVLASQEYEADDLIASCSDRARAHQYHCQIWSQDKDLIQCLHQDADRLIRPDRKAEQSRDTVHDTFGLWPEQWVDFQALTGDGVDGIPGVPGIGSGAATHLLKRFDDLDGIYRNIDQVSQQPWRGSARHARLLAENREAAELSRQLATLVCDALPFQGMDAFRRKFGSGIQSALMEAGYGGEHLNQWCQRFGVLSQ